MGQAKTQTRRWARRLLGGALAAVAAGAAIWRLAAEKTPVRQAAGEALAVPDPTVFAVLDSAASADMKIIGFCGGHLMVSDWLEGERTAPDSDPPFEELFLDVDTATGTTRLVRASQGVPASCADPFVLNETTLFTFPYENQRVDIVRRDWTDGSTRVVYTQEDMGGSLVGCAKISDDTASFLLPLADADLIVTWDDAEGRLLEIFSSWELAGDTAPAITAIASDGTNLYALVKEDTGKNKLLCCSQYGAVLWERDIGLSGYEDPDYNADQLYVFGDTFFIKWFYCGSEPYFTVLEKTGDRFVRRGLPQSCPCSLLTPEPVNGEWLIFSTFSESVLDSVGMAVPSADYCHLALYNVVSQQWQPVRLDLEPEAKYQLFADEQGNVVAQILSETGETTALRRYTSDSILP